METCEPFYVRASAASLFVLIFGIPLCVVSLMVFGRFGVDTYFLIPPLLLLYTGSLLLAWLYSVGSYIAKVYDLTMRLGYQFFRASIVYWLLTLWLIFPTSYFVGNFAGDEGTPSLLSMIVLSLYGIEVVAIYYVLGYVSKLIADAGGRRQNIARYIATFVGLVALPVGIWFIQPKINNIWEKEH